MHLVVADTKEPRLKWLCRSFQPLCLFIIPITSMHSFSIHSTCTWKILIVPDLCHPLKFFLFPPLQVGDRSFPLETVKQLKELMDVDQSVSPRLAETSVVAVCANPLLPQIFHPVCQGKGAGIVFSELGKTEQRRNKQITNTEITDIKYSIILEWVPLESPSNLYMKEWLLCENNIHL